LSKSDGIIDTFLSFAKSHSHTGTGDEISTLAIGIAKSSSSLDKATMAICREELENLGISSKVFSKLKVIGKTLLQLNEKERGEVVKRLPPSYGTIHVLCGLKPQELLTAVKSGVITKTLSIRSATTYVKQIRYPHLSARDGGEKGRWSINQENLFSVVRTDGTALEGEALHDLEKALRRVCKQYGVDLRHANAFSANTLRKEARGEREVFWRAVLEKNLQSKWFKERPEEIRKQFNLKTVQELHHAPLRTFTGFLQRSDGGKAEFWQKHGQNYVAKVHLEMEKTDDHAQRYNLKRRLEEVLGDRRELAIWTNLMLKEGGYA
jgi:hypothetical protein